MDVQTNFNIPFDQFDWRTTLFDMLHDHFVEAACEVLSQYQNEQEEIDWKDEEALMGFALTEDLFAKIAERAKQSAEEVMRSNHE